jgi:hypothetical protein
VASRIAEPIDESQIVTLPGNVHPLSNADYDRGESDPATPTGRIELLFRHSSTQQLALRQYLADLQNPHSAGYHKWLTSAQYGAAYGISDADLAKVEDWLQRHGLTVESVSPARNMVEFSGTFAQIEDAFHTSMHTLAVGGETHFANISNPAVPAALAPVIAGVGPLNDFHPQSNAKFGAHGRFNTASRTIQPDLTLFSSAGTPFLFVAPADAATIYDTPNSTLNPAYTGTTYDGSGVEIGIVGDSNITMQDVTNYRIALLGESASTANIPTVVIDGDDPGINGDEIEGLLDSEVAGGIAPKARLTFYTAANTDLQSGLFLAIFRAIGDNTVSVLNISFGACEAKFGTSGNELVSEVMSQAAAQGISVTVSTGDSGSAGCDSSGSESAENGLAVNGLASSPYTIAVGGTDFDVLPNDFTAYVQDSSGGQGDSGTAPYYRTALSYIPERPWNNSTSPNTSIASNVPLTSNGKTTVAGGGGGASNCAQSTSTSSSVTCQAGYAKPAFQSSLTPSDGVRDLPDVSFLAANGLYSATWAVCADNVALDESYPVFTDCQTNNGQFTSSTSFSGIGGTSAAAPAFAGMLALVVQKTGSRLGQADYVLYQLANSRYSTVFHDVTTGDNSVVCTSGSPNCGANGFLTGYDAATGYDRASGLGSVDAAQMIENWGTVSLANTTTSFTINGSTAPIAVKHGTSLTLNAGVSPSTATGLVGIVDNANQNEGGALNNGQTSIPLVGGSGTATYNGLPGGSYTVYAMYGGDSTDAASTSTGISVTITPEDSTASLQVSAADADGNAITNLSSVPYGSYLYEDVDVYGAAEGSNSQGLATGTVTFLDNGAKIGSAQISSAGQAYFGSPASSVSALPVGTHSLSASYAGDSSLNASTSSTVTVTIVKAATTLSLQPTSTTINSQASDLIEIPLEQNGAGALPTGTIAITDNGMALTSFPVTFGVEMSTTLSGAAMPVGQNTITATYSGDANYSGSTASTTITVTSAGFSLSNSGPLAITAGASTGNTATISVLPSNGFLGVVNLSCSVQALAGAATPVTCSIPATADVTSGPVTTKLSVATTTSTSNGSYTVTVSGEDASTGKISTSTAVAVTVSGSSAPSGSFALSNSGSITVSPGATSGNSSTVTVTPSNGFTGQVNLTCAVTTNLTGVTYTPTCTLPASVTIAGTTAATATLSVSTTAGTTALGEEGLFRRGGMVLAGILLLFGPQRRRILSGLAGILLLIAVGITGCGSSSSSGKTTTGTTAGAYTITVTGTDQSTGKITATTAISLNVN